MNNRLRHRGILFTWYARYCASLTGLKYSNGLGIEHLPGRNVPIQVENLTGVISVAGYGYSLALKSDGTVWSANQLKVKVVAYYAAGNSVDSLEVIVNILDADQFPESKS